MNNILFIVIGAGIATMVPRLLPFVLGDKIKLPQWLNDFLSFVPFTAVAALTFPSLFTATSSIVASISGGIVAALVAYKNSGMLVTILSSITVTMIMLWILVY